MRTDGVYGFYPIVPDTSWLQRVIRLGARTVQLRLKHMSRSQVMTEIRTAIQWVQAYEQELATSDPNQDRVPQENPVSIQLIINDYWQEAIDGEGKYVHIGQEDLVHTDCVALREAGIRYGISTHSLAELEHALLYQPDYVALGPIFAPTGKSVSWAPQGVEKIPQWKQRLDVPLVAIGGITRQTAPQVVQAGADSIAVIGDIVFHKDPETQIVSWLQWFQNRDNPSFSLSTQESMS